MTISKNQLANELADLDLDTIKSLREQALAVREEAARKASAALDDPHGTVRYDAENDLFLRREIDATFDETYKSWVAYFPERHAGVEDEDVDPQACPVVGNIFKEEQDD